MGQNALERWLIDEIISDKKWKEAFGGSEDVLDKLADEALAEHAQGKTKPLEINSSIGIHDELDSPALSVVKALKEKL